MFQLKNFELMLYLAIILVSFLSILCVFYFILTYLTYFFPHSRSLDVKDVEITDFKDRMRFDLKGSYSLIRTHCETNSNSPVIECTDTLITSKVSNDSKLKIGDTVVYQITNNREFSTPPWILIGSSLRIFNLEKLFLPPSRNIRIVHSIISYDSERDCYILKGINNLLPDPYCIKKEDIYLKIAAVIYTDEPYAY